MSLNSKDLYPYTRKNLAMKLGYVSESSLYQKEAFQEISPVNSTYIGSSEYYNEAAVEELRAKGFECKYKKRSFYRTLSEQNGDVAHETHTATKASGLTWLEVAKELADAFPDAAVWVLKERV